MVLIIIKVFIFYSSQGLLVIIYNENVKKILVVDILLFDQ